MFDVYLLDILLDDELCYVGFFDRFKWVEDKEGVGKLYVGYDVFWFVCDCIFLIIVKVEFNS